MKHVRLVASAIILAVAGCSAESAEPARVAELEKELQSLRTELAVQRLSNSAFSTATFDPADAQGYQRVNSTVGTFVIALDNIEPYLDGYRVRMRVGNLTSATFHGANLKVKWGSRLSNNEGNANDALEAYERWLSALQEREVKSTAVIRAGAWNSVEFTIAPGPADGLGYLSISIETDELTLYR